MAGKRLSGERRRHRRHTAKEKAAVLKDLGRLTVREAAKAHGVPSGTVGHWFSAASAAQGRGAGRPKKAPPHSEPKAGAAEAVPAAPATTKAKKVRRAARRYTPSEKAEILEHASQHEITQTARKFGVSRFSIYDWARKLQRAAVGEGPSPTSGPAPTEVEQQRDQEILGEWRRHPGLGPSQIRNQLRRKGIKVGLGTVRRVMEEAGYRPPKVRRERHDGRFEAVRPNHLWHLDFVHQHIHRASTFTLILLDDHSRFVVGHAVADVERADVVVQAFEEAVQRHGKPEMVMHDKGSAFWSWRGISRFTALLAELGIDQIVAQHKEWNGKVEVFNANLQKELFDAQRFYDLAEMRRRLAAHLEFYNHQRTHHALGGLLVPADRYFGRAEAVLARIEAGAGRDERIDAVNLGERSLELFKVISHRGVPEVWLMGRKVLELGP